jgi:hypothetical protein
MAVTLSDLLQDGMPTFSGVEKYRLLFSSAYPQTVDMSSDELEIYLLFN